MTVESANFHFLRSHDVELVRRRALAERYFQDDPSTCLIKLRQFAELLAQLTAARTGLFISTNEAQADLLRRLKLERVISPQVADLFHQIRTVGNRATHQYTGNHAEALTQLRMARHLAIWFHRTFGGDRQFKAGAFVPPSNPAEVTADLAAELERLRLALEETRSEAEKARLAAEEQASAVLSAEEKARREAEERSLWEQLAIESEQARSALEVQLATLQTAAKQLPAQQTAAVIALADQASSAIDLDEDETRAIIDQQLQNAGWLADTRNLRYSKGVRPARGQNMAIAEWPTANGIADYALFIGTRCIGVIEAKRRRKNVSAAIDQAERYAKGFQAVVNPAISLEQLFDELAQVTEPDHRTEIRDQIVVKLRRLRQLADQARASYQAQVGETPEATLERFRTLALPELADWAKAHLGIGQILDWNPEGGRLLPIAHHPDQVVAVSRGYGTGQRPDDFLDSFTAYLRNNSN